MATLYVPGTQEKDLSKIIMSLQNVAAAFTSVFSTYTTTYANFSGNVGIGLNSAPDSLLTINANTAASVAPTAGVNTYLHIVGADSANGAAVSLDSYGGQNIVVARRANGTQASKTAVVAADILLAQAALGWDTTIYNTGANIQYRATETWSPTAHGAEFAIRVVSNTTTTVTDGLVVRNSGGVTIGSSTDPGTGGLRLSGSMFLGGFTVASLPTGAAAGNTAFATNCRVFNGTGTQEGAGAGTGGLVTYNGSAWKIAGTNVTAVA